VRVTINLGVHKAFVLSEAMELFSPVLNSIEITKQNSTWEIYFEQVMVAIGTHGQMCKELYLHLCRSLETKVPFKPVDSSQLRQHMLALIKRDYNDSELAEIGLTNYNGFCNGNKNNMNETSMCKCLVTWFYSMTIYLNIIANMEKYFVKSQISDIYSNGVKVLPLFLESINEVSNRYVDKMFETN
jgi:hypothetical protein